MRNRRVITAAVTALAAIASLSLAAIGSPTTPATSATAPAAASASATASGVPAGRAGSAALPSPGKPCDETDACFNPCTMGVDGTHPAHDPRYWIPGPCDMGSPLPHGRRFVLSITPADPAAVADLRCGPDQRAWLPVWVRVWQREADGSGVEGSAATATVCVPLVNGMPDLTAVTPGLFRAVADPGA